MKIRAFLMLSLSWSGLAVAAPKAPLEGEALKLKDNLVELFEMSKKVDDPAEAERKKARNRVESALDWDRIAKDCLGKRWSTASASDRQEFKKLLQEVVIRTAYTRLTKFWGETQKYEFEKVEIKDKGKAAHVATKFYVGKDDFLLEYYMNKPGGVWKIYDIAFEDLRYSENISEQILAFMKDNKFSSLLDKLRKRRDELRESETKKG